MKNKPIIVVALLLLFSTLMVNNIVAQGNTTATAKHKIVMQLTSPDTLVYAGLFKQLKNLKEGWGNEVVIEVVCHGPGINLLHTDKTKFSEKIKQATAQGIIFVACENTLKEKQIAKEKILPEAAFVLMGIGEIVEKQEQGWSYIKAGF